MPIRHIALSAVFAAGMAVLPLTADAQYYGPPCSPFPLTWPFCIVGAVGYAITAPFRPVAPPRPYYYGYAGAPPYYAPPPPPYAPPPPGPAPEYGAPPPR